MSQVAEGVGVSQVLRIVRAVDVARPDARLTGDPPNLSAHRQFDGAGQRENRRSKAQARRHRERSPRSLQSSVRVVAVRHYGGHSRRYIAIGRPGYSLGSGNGSRARSYASATLKTVVSSKGFPIICIETGSPFGARPVGIASAGWPVTLNGAVKR